MIANHKYLYTYACHETERELCGMELRALLQLKGGMPEQSVESSVGIAPGRSPFIKQRLDIEMEADSLEELIDKVALLDPLKETFKVVCLKTAQGPDYKEQRRMERQIGAEIRGTPSMKQPDLRFGTAWSCGRWVFGRLHEAEAAWLKHQNKPRAYSTALSTRVARAAVNIAVPVTEGARAVDPCCGIGTVLLEAISMGIEIEGFDKNPLAVAGARENLLHFGYADIAAIADMRSLTKHYDVAIIDFPYNLCSVLPAKELLEMLVAARRIADRALVIFASNQPVEEQLAAAGWEAADSCAISKGTFTRRMVRCE
ncbi:TRM11 family SAM-dependent methyltransferase [Paenibacillus sp. GCM10012307]|uniref:RsmD family RNA methyltransferase n=1 Tax=Paenibacillus roseus TaxID=2798579 RepID=A0A934MNT7_9BACL|nr:RsmD family RNA methyltransferase [Paenibacillus roseus]MBJ6361361.1 RsmD family RNA methyltransferase [Paenibacillus roseus]